MFKKNTDNLNSVIIIGSGGNGCVVADCLISMGRKIIGFTDKKKHKFSYNNIKILGNDDIIFNYKNNEIDIALGIGIVPYKTDRIDLIKALNKRQFKIISVVSSKTIISKSAKLGMGIQICQGAVIQSNARIGNYSIINTNVSVDHDSVIGSNCHIAPGVTICGNVTILDNVFIGAGSTIIQGVRIGVNSFIPAGSIIINNIDDHTKYNSKINNN